MLVFATSCTEDKSSVANDEVRLKVEAMVVEREVFENSLEVTGNILPNEAVEIKAPIEGIVLDIYFKEGQQVSKGARLVRLDDRTWRAQAEGVRARIKAAKTLLDRKKSLLEIEGASQEEVDNASAELVNLEANLQELQVNIDLANVRAPFSGTVGLRDFSLGAYLGKGDVITQLAQTDRLKLNFDLPAKYALGSIVGKTVDVISERDTFKASVYAIEPSVSNSSRSFSARAYITQGKHNLTPGDFAQVVYNQEVDSAAILIPTEAVMQELQGQVVFLLKNGAAKKQKVTVGTRTSDQVQILEGLSVGDSVITAGLLQLKDGTKVDASAITIN